MKSDEIKKALGHCEFDNCSGCPLADIGECFNIAVKEALNYINTLEGKIENYKHLDVILNTAIDTLTQKIKSEVIKEFAEKVKLKFYEEFDELIPSIMADEIDTLAKEMVGENNGI